ncbi:MAG: PEP-CTERM sorting domain-containing protein [Bryobacteraceae bacterium]|jgi:hypothetical protein
MMIHRLRRVFLALLAGTAVAAAGPMLYSITSLDGGDFSLSSISPAGQLNMLFPLGAGFTGGLAFDPSSNLFYAVSSDENAASTLNSISWTGEVTPLFSLGYGFFGGLAYAGAPGTFYAIGGDANGVQRSLYSISLAGGGSATLIEDLEDGSLSYDGGLAYAGGLYVIGSDGAHWGVYSYPPMVTAIELGGMFRSVFFPAAGGLAHDPVADSWWALAIDNQTLAPRLVNFNSSAPISTFSLSSGPTGLTFAEDLSGGPGNVPEPGSALLFALGLVAILVLRRRA